MYILLYIRLYEKLGDISADISITFSNLSCTIPTQPFYTWCNMFLTGLHHSPVVSIPLFLLSNSSILPFHLFPFPFPPLRAPEFEAIIIIISKTLDQSCVTLII